MNKYNSNNGQIWNLPQRKSIRLKGYDYSQVGLYFITICTQNRIDLFGDIKNGEMHLNYFGEIAKKEWEKTAEIRKNCSLEEYIIMPNHFHFIISINYKISSEENNIGKFKSPSNTIGAIIRGYKGSTTKKIKELIRENLNLSEILKNRENLSTGELQFAPTEEIFEILNKLKKRELYILLNKSIWQRNYWEHIIRNEKEYSNISKYIINNPQKWENDKLNGKNGNIVMESEIEYNSKIWMV